MQSRSNIHQIFFSGSVHRLADKEAAPADAVMATQLCAAYNLTGLTLFTDGTFMSVLEGREEDTLTVYQEIKKDPRFTHTNVIMNHAREQAEFSAYRIGFSGKDFSGEVAAAFELTNESFTRALPAAPSSHLRILAGTFARVNGFTLLQAKAA